MRLQPPSYGKWLGWAPRNPGEPAEFLGDPMVLAIETLEWVVRAVREANRKHLAEQICCNKNADF